MKTTIAALALIAACAAPAAAQIPVGTRVGDVSVGSYDSRGRRDPFVSLVAAKRPTTTLRGAKPGQGLASLILSDVTVTGIVRKEETMMAILQGADRQSYVAKVGDHIADAIVKSIDTRGVTFADATDLGSGEKPQETRKALRAAAEVNR
jgi:hypothetical protein